MVPWSWGLVYLSVNQHRAESSGVVGVGPLEEGLPALLFCLPDGFVVCLSSLPMGPISCMDLLPLPPDLGIVPISYW